VLESIAVSRNAGFAFGRRICSVRAMIGARPW